MIRTYAQKFKLALASQPPPFMACELQGMRVTVVFTDQYQRHCLIPQVRLLLFSGDLVMDLPTPREIELETALRKRDAEVAELTVRSPPSAQAVAGRVLSLLNLPRTTFHGYASF
jgi:hypothetical protein